MKKIIAILLAVLVSSTSWAAGHSGNSSASEWDQIKAWLSQNHPQHLPLLNPGATKDKIKSVKSQLGYKLPAELISVLRVNDGESHKSHGLFGTLRLLPVAEQITEYKILLTDERFPRARYHPILLSGGGDYYCIDLRTGEVVEWWHEGGVNGIVAQSLTEFLRDFSSQLRKGQFVSVPDIRGLVDKDDL